ncbi:unnamed protein product [Bursaphelenchus okinawaensis]|uniref:F-box domain-containing protein n=1 Tax=Bursaphelenchus okinawaensis TaxID=465554 RepID=A0A811KK21_9BILA|nr:unnamed protein product [Bursaphelenchus okinawaensis]CAG9105324.1 unnamed protein product [Bursaphelenchus okinawaensis]
MLPVLPDDLLLRLLSFCDPDDVNNFCLLDKRLNEFVQFYRWHLPKENANCSIRVDQNDNVYIKMSPASRFSRTQRCKKFLYSAKSKKLDVLSGFNILNLAITGTHFKTCIVTPSFLCWLQSFLSVRNLPQLQYLSFKYLDFSQLNQQTAANLFRVLNDDTKISIKNCIFNSTSEIYNIILNVGRYEYFVEHDNNVINLDYNVHELSRLSEYVLDRALTGCSTKLDLGSLIVPDVGVIANFVKKWSKIPNPNDFSQLSFQCLVDHLVLVRHLLSLSHAKTVPGTNVISVNNKHDPTLIIFVHIQKLYIHMGVKSIVLDDLR